jgi:poly(A) polymerase/tRNA nucleotidyltransferase (CCA-adding enzyme)
LIWPDIVLELQEALVGVQIPVYIVGGAVRDAYLHRPVKDIDLAAPERGAALARQIANHLKGDFFVLDDERDVGRALVETAQGRIVIDVARFRGADLLADLVDRDFTLNAMAVDIRYLSHIIDPLKGQQAIEEKVLRRCSPDAIASDPIRALRAVRQSVQFGLRIEAETLRDVRANAGRLLEPSPERVRDEFFKLLSLPEPASALRIADTVSLLRVIIPEVEPLHGLQQSAPHVFDAWRHTLAVIEYLSQIAAAFSYARTDSTAATFGLGMMVMQLDRYRARLNQHLQSEWPNERSHLALLMLAALLHDSGKVAVRLEGSKQGVEGYEQVSAHLAAERAEALRLSNAEKERLAAVIRNHRQALLWQENLTRLDLYRFWRDLNEVGVDVCLFALADYLGTVGAELDQDTWLALVERVRALLEAYYEHYEEWIAPPMLIDGNQLMQALGLQPGRQVGALLELIREHQAIGDIQSVEDALSLARQHLNNHR